MARDPAAESEVRNVRRIAVNGSARNMRLCEA